MDFKIITRNCSDYTFHFFKSRTDWDSYISGIARGQLMPNNTYPREFPCLMVSTFGHICRDNGPDEFPNFFFYEGEFEYDNDE